MKLRRDICSSVLNYIQFVVFNHGAVHSKEFIIRLRGKQTNFIVTANSWSMRFICNHVVCLVVFLKVSTGLHYWCNAVSFYTLVIVFKATGVTVGFCRLKTWFSIQFDVMVLVVHSFIVLFCFSKCNQMFVDGHIMHIETVLCLPT